jgi:hypothetical protein
MLIRVIIIIVMLLSMIMPAQADRLKDLETRYGELIMQRQRLNEEILRIEGAFAERKAILAEEVKEVILNKEAPKEEPKQ